MLLFPQFAIKIISESKLFISFLKNISNVLGFLSNDGIWTKDWLITYQYQLGNTKEILVTFWFLVNYCICFTIDDKYIVKSKTDVINNNLSDKKF